MADREAYNECMKPHMAGKDKTKQERQRGMCVGAKLCTGKAKTPEEAEKICSQPRLPKWAKEALPAELKGDELTCPEKIKRTIEHIDAMMLKIGSGEAEEVKPLAALVYSDALSCRPEMIQGLIDEAMTGVNDLAKRHYLKGEAKEVESQLKVIREVLAT